MLGFGQIFFLGEAAGGGEKGREEDDGQIKVHWLVDGKERRKQEKGRGYGDWQRKEGRPGGKGDIRGNEMPPGSLYGSST